MRYKPVHKDRCTLAFNVGEACPQRNTSQSETRFYVFYDPFVNKKKKIKE